MVVSLFIVTSKDPYYGALKVHEIITNLEIYTDKVDKGDIVTDRMM